MRILRRLLERFPRKFSRWLLVPAFAAVVVLAFAGFAFFRAQHSLETATESVAQNGHYAFDLRQLDLVENPGFESIASPASYVSGAFYRGKLYVSGSFGLSVFGAADSTGQTLQRIYRVGLDLPAAPLGAMVVGRLRGASEPELLIATSGAGVLIFSQGSSGAVGSFRQILPRDAEARKVTALLPLPSGELLIGTEHRGLLVYRGVSGKSDLETLHPQLAGVAITALAADASGFWVGTRNHGVRHWHGGRLDSFEAELVTGSLPGPLPDQQVEAIAVRGDKVFVGTPLGVEEFDHGRPARLLAKDLFAHALFADDKAITVGTLESGDDTGGSIQLVSLESERRPGIASDRLHAVGQDFNGAPQQFLKGDDDASEKPLYAVLSKGLQRRQADGNWTPLQDVPLITTKSSAVLTDGNISALAFAPDGRLWVGFFDRGLDILSAAGQATEHREDDHLFCINRIVVDPRRKTMAAATANGLVLFDERGKARQVMTKKDGLIADHVTDIAFSRDSMVLATPAGLTFLDAAGARSLYGFQGLVNNHVYALGAQPETGEVLAGTLGGVSLLVNEDVQRNLTAANSGLQHNWVTAILPLADKTSSARWMVGTYGAGVLQLDQNGHFSAMEGATQAMVINPNAMLQTNAHIFAGTLGKGLWIWSRGNGRWRQITAGLPSENVTAVAEHAGEIYVGTDNGLVRIAERLLN